MFKKTITFNEKRGVKEAQLEIELQQVASAHGFCPQITDVKFTETECTITMAKVDAMCLADMYGDQETDLPQHLWSKIHHIVKTLYEEEGIVYVDITPYNFIEINDAVYIIDFGDAYYKETKPFNWFHTAFLENPSMWNPDFA
jgi:tRNA A-37 threonylcarbamoyl transferase component Bud32